MGELEEDVESMQGMILMLQQQLKEAREQINRLQQDNDGLRKSHISLEPGGQAVKEEIADKESTAGSVPLQHKPQSFLSGIGTLLSATASEKDADTLKIPAHTNTPFGVSSNSNFPPAFSSSSQISTFNLSPPAFKETPDSGVQTQEEEEDLSSMDTAGGDFVSEGDDVLKRNSDHLVLPDVNMDKEGVCMAPVSSDKTSSPCSENTTAVQPPSRLDGECVDPEKTSSSLTNISLSDYHSHNSDSLRTTSPVQLDESVRTAKDSHIVVKDNCSSDTFGDRTSVLTAPVPLTSNGDELTKEGGDEEAGKAKIRTCSDEENVSVSDVDSAVVVDVHKRSDCAVVVAATDTDWEGCKLKGNTNTDPLVQLTNGSNDCVDGPDM